MGSIGFSEILLIIFIALLLFGPENLPKLGKAIGRAAKEFKKVENEVKEIFKDESTLKKGGFSKEKEEGIKNLKKDE